MHAFLILPIAPTTTNEQTLQSTTRNLQKSLSTNHPTSPMGTTNHHAYGPTTESRSTTSMSMSMPSTMPMPMTFFTSTSTPLYTIAWKPTTPSQYALTCLFLVLLCIVFRALLAARCNLQAVLLGLARVGRRRKVSSSSSSSCCAEVEADDEADLDEDVDGKESLRDEKNRLHDQSARAGGRTKRAACGYRGGEVLLRALLDTSLGVVSYLL